MNIIMDVSGQTTCLVVSIITIDSYVSCLIARPWVHRRSNGPITFFCGGLMLLAMSLVGPTLVQVVIQVVIIYRGRFQISSSN